MRSRCWGGSGMRRGSGWGTATWRRMCTARRDAARRSDAVGGDAYRISVEAFGLRLTLLPVSDDRIRTVVETAGGETLAFQEYFVKRRTEDDVRAVRFDGIDAARPAPGVLEAIAGADVIAIAPSNPIVSIGPVLAVRGVRDALRETRARKSSA